MITGNVETREVFIMGHKLNPGRSQGVYNHSPDGYSWGYEGSGCAQLALAILLEFVDKGTAVGLHQKFKREIIASMDVDADFCLPKDTVELWLQKQSVKK